MGCQESFERESKRDKSGGAAVLDKSPRPTEWEWVDEVVNWKPGENTAIIGCHCLLRRRLHTVGQRQTESFLHQYLSINK